MEKRDRNLAEYGLKRFFVGEEGLEFDEESSDGQSLLRDFRDRLEGSLPEPVITQLRLCRQIIEPWDRANCWRVSIIEKGPFRGNVVREGVRMINHYQSANSGENDVDVQLYKDAKYFSEEAYRGWKERVSIQRG